MNWVDLGTDVDWAQRTVEQMEKVIVVYFFGRNFPGRLRRCNCLFGDVLDIYVCSMMDMFNCRGQEIKMAEQRYSESSSSSSVSTMAV